jgi:hypothetical protein
LNYWPDTVLNNSNGCQFEGAVSGVTAGQSGAIIANNSSSAYLGFSAEL